MKKCTLYRLSIFNFLSAEKRRTSKKQGQAFRDTVPYVYTTLRWFTKLQIGENMALMKGNTEGEKLLLHKHHISPLSTVLVTKCPALPTSVVKP
jgi:hypothetical protein